MYRVTCSCAKTEFYRIQIVPKLIYRKCKECKSNLIVYKDDTLVFNYNNKKDRVTNRRIHKSKIDKMPLLVSNVFDNEISNPVKHDVFIGYQYVFESEVDFQSQNEIDIESMLNPTFMENNQEDISSCFDFNNDLFYQAKEKEESNTLDVFNFSFQECTFRECTEKYNMPKFHACSKCEWKFKRLYDLRRHERSHNHSKLFRCIKCKAKFVRKDALKRHHVRVCSNLTNTT